MNRPRRSTVSAGIRQRRTTYMPRNFEKDQVIGVSFPRTGPAAKTREALLADAAYRNKLHRLGEFIFEIVQKYYEAEQEGRILPRGVTYSLYTGVVAPIQQQGPVFAASSLNGHQPIAPTGLPATLPATPATPATPNVSVPQPEERPPL